MTIPPRALAAALGLSFVISLAAWPLPAQEPAPGKAAEKSALQPKRAYDPARRVPDYFGQIGLTGEQREAIYKIRGKHLQKIDELERQIDAIQAQMLHECEAVLTDTQKQLLEHRRRAGVQGKKAAEPPAAKPAAK